MKKGILVSLLWMYCQIAMASSVADDDSELFLFFDEEELVEIASRHLQSLNKAPAIVSVVTRREIRNMGARNLFDVLRREAGIGVTLNHFGKYQIEFRGNKHVDAANYKLMIDGHSVHDDLSAGSSYIFDKMSIENVKRIEIIRGPGSALYGSGAFAGVINVVTVNGEDIDGTTVTAGGGSFGTQHYNLLAGKQSGDWDTAFMLDLYDTDGAELDVASDLFLHSGKTQFNLKRLDAGVKLSYKDFSFNSRYVSFDRGPYVGVIGALNDESEVNQTQYFLELAYQHEISKKANFNARAYQDRVPEFDLFWEIISETDYPGGMIGNPMAEMQSHGSELQFDLELAENNFLTIGALSEKRKMKDIKHIGNFDGRLFIGGAPNPAFGAPLGALTDISADANWLDISKTERDIWAIYLQDIWNITDTLDLTVGVRHDDYSDVGSTTNPRAALVWQFHDDWDLKTLYGEAFRAPSFAELYLLNNTAYLGNTALVPETMKTFELSLGHTISSNDTTRLTFFDTALKDKIQALPQGGGLSQFGNSAGSDVQGLEFEFEKQFNSGHSLYANLTYQDAKEKNTDKPVADVANRKANIGTNLVVGRHLNVNLNLFATSAMPRQSADPSYGITADPRTNATAGYALVDLAVIGKELHEGLEVRGSVYNLLDKEYVDPALAGSVTSDLPREGRSLMIELSYEM